MKSTVIIIGLLAFTSIALAQNKGPMEAELAKALKTTGKSHYEVLEELFSKGAQTKAIVDLTKASKTSWSGRCYYEINPNEAFNSGYIFKVRKGNFSPKLFDVFNYQEERGEEDFFDKMSSKDIFEWNSRLTPDEVEEGKGFPIMVSSTERREGFSQLVTSGKYIIEEVTEFRASTKPGRLFKHWVVIGHCYYFPTIKITK